MKNYNYQKNDSENSFHFAASLIKIIAVVIAIPILLISKWAIAFFIGAMLPTIIAILFDRNYHKCASATICSFNLIGVLPYLMRLWNSQSINNMAKSIIVDIDTWMVIYGVAFVGQLLYLAIPSLVIKYHAAKNQVQINNLEKKYKQITEQWGILTEKDNNDLRTP